MRGTHGASAAPNARTPGERVIVTPPVYPPFFELVAEAGGVAERVPLHDTGTGWELDLDAITDDALGLVGESHQRTVRKADKLAVAPQVWRNLVLLILAEGLDQVADGFVGHDQSS